MSGGTAEALGSLSGFSSILVLGSLLGPLPFCVLFFLSQILPPSFSSVSPCLPLSAQ